jgi:hypothetical protein
MRGRCLGHGCSLWTFLAGALLIERGPEVPWGMGTDLRNQSDRVQ